ncbi:spore germination protein [Neobacillus drentensis]|uniref:spore germination protein n=1 Tax=Neobacillus drentensis TaxID=220684 RepID=UPI0030027D32
MTNSSKAPITIQDLKDWFKNSSDIHLKTKYFNGRTTSHTLVLVYCPNLVDMQIIFEVILPRMMDVALKEDTITFDRLSSLMEITKLDDDKDIKNEVEQKLFSGELVIFNNASNDLYFISISNPPKRGPEESVSAPSIRGPRDGFVENISDNMSLVRQRLKSSSLTSIEYTIGERSKTKILLLYLDDIINPSILDVVQKRLESLKIDILGSSNQLEEMIYDNPFSIMPLMGYFSRPEYVVESLNQGRFAILVDGNPSCLIGPTTLNQLLLTPEDAHNSFFYVSLVRILRILSIVTTIFLPGFYISLVTFQPNQIPYTLLATITVSRLGLPLTAPLEAFIMLTLFELFKEVGVRLPKATGGFVSVLGGLFIGNAAIQAGLTSPTMMVVISITFISGYTLVNQNLAGNLALIRYFSLLLSSTLGFLGFFISFFFIATYILSLESFGVPYMSGFSVPNKSDVIKIFIKLPYMLLKKRNLAYHPTDSDRQKE